MCFSFLSKDWAQIGFTYFEGFLHTRVKFETKKKIVAKESIFVGTKALKWDFVFLFLWRTEPKWPFWGIFTTRVKFKKKKNYFFLHGFQISLASHIFIFTTFWEIFGKRINFCGDQSTKMGFCVFTICQKKLKKHICRERKSTSLNI